MCIFRHHCLYFEFKCSKRIADYLFIMHEHHASQLQVNNKLVHTSHAYIELWMHAGSLENTREAKELLEAQPRATLASCVLSKLPKCVYITIYAQLKHEPIIF